MPAQATRGTVNPFNTCKPKASGVYRIEIYKYMNDPSRIPVHASMYAYYSKSDELWYSVLGNVINKSGGLTIYWLRRS